MTPAKSHTPEESHTPAKSHTPEESHTPKESYTPEKRPISAFVRRSGWAVHTVFAYTVPVMTGYLCLGLAYGLLMYQVGYGPLWSLAFSLLVYGGSVQYVGIPLLTAPFAPLQTFLIGLMVSARHIFYGLSFLERYRDMGRVKPFLIFSLTDETFSLLSTLRPPEGMPERDFCFWISLLDYCYWASGSFLGGLLGQLLTFHTAGMEFALTALFTVLFVEQWKTPGNRPSCVTGVVCTLISLFAFGPDGFVIPSMILILMVLLIGRRKFLSWAER